MFLCLKVVMSWVLVPRISVMWSCCIELRLFINLINGLVAKSHMRLCARAHVYIGVHLGYGVIFPSFHLISIFTKSNIEEKTLFNPPIGYGLDIRFDNRFAKSYANHIVRKPMTM